jgi:hypothetical protein
MDRYFDEPLILVQLELADLIARLHILASHALTPLPDRHQRELALMQRRVQAILREVRTRPDALLRERHRDDQDRPSSRFGGTLDA